MNTEPLISVVVPTHNRESIVARAVRSILQQTYPNLELLLVDDASTDDTRRVIEEFGDKRIRYLRHDTNRGGAVARNTGIQAARGEYIAFLDSDDEWLPAKLELQVAAMRGSNAKFSYCQSVRVENGIEHVYPHQPFRSGSLIEYLSTDTQGGMSTPALIVRRDLGVRFDETLSVYQDWDFVMQIRHRTADFCFVPQPLCRIHFDAPNRTRQFKGRPLIERVRPFLAKYKNELQDAPNVQRFIVWGCVLNALEQKDRPRARAMLWEYRLFPSLRRQPHAFKAWWQSYTGY